MRQQELVLPRPQRPHVSPVTGSEERYRPAYSPDLCECALVCTPRSQHLLRSVGEDTTHSSTHAWANHAALVGWRITQRETRGTPNSPRSWASAQPNSHSARNGEPRSVH